MCGLWLALSPTASTLADPYIKAMNAMPRVILAPIFAVWFGLGIASKVVFGVTLVFFIVFFNVYQGVKEVSPVVLANARMLGASGRQLLRHVYLPSATSWVFSSLHTSIGLAFVGAVVGEYLGSARGVGYLIQQAEGVFDIDTVLAGILVLTVFALILDFIVTRIESRCWCGARAPRRPSRCRPILDPHSAVRVIILGSDAGWSSLAARRAHNPKVTGSNPVPATNNSTACLRASRLHFQACAVLCDGRFVLYDLGLTVRIPIYQ